MGLDMEIRHYTENGDRDFIYMRKVNWIRNYFANNLDNFEDNGTTTIPKAKFKELLDLMKQLINETAVKKIFPVYKKSLDIDCGELSRKSEAMIDEFVANGGEEYERFKEKADELLPTCSGFFFGSIEYDSWYISELLGYYIRLKNLYNSVTDVEWENGDVFYWEWY